MLEIRPNNKNWHTRGDDTKARLSAAACLTKGKIVDAKDTIALLEAVLHPGDNVNIEGDNQKQADFLAGELCKVDPSRVHDLHMIQSTLSIPEHLDVFEKGLRGNWISRMQGARVNAWRRWYRTAASNWARFILIWKCTAATLST